MELAAPGNQILLGDHQFYNGAGFGLSLVVLIKWATVWVYYDPTQVSSQLRVSKFNSLRVAVKISMEESGVLVTFRGNGVNTFLNPGFPAFTRNIVLCKPIIFLSRLGRRRQYYLLNGFRIKLRSMSTFFSTITSKALGMYEDPVFAGEVCKNLVVYKSNENNAPATFDVTSNSFFNNLVSSRNLKVA